MVRVFKEFFGESEFEVREQLSAFDGWRVVKVERLFCGMWVAAIFRWEVAK